MAMQTIACFAAAAIATTLPCSVNATDDICHPWSERDEASVIVQTNDPINRPWILIENHSDNDSTIMIDTRCDRAATRYESEIDVNPRQSLLIDGCRVAISPNKGREIAQGFWRLVGDSAPS